MKKKIPNSRKGIGNIKTHAGTVDQTFLPHKAFMRISCLEMEKAHRIKEMESSRQRIETVKNRIKEIDAEKDILLNRIKSADNAQVNVKVGNNVGTKAGDKNDKGLVLRY